MAIVDGSNFFFKYHGTYIHRQKLYMLFTGLGMSALFTSTGNMGDVMPCFDLPLFLMSGAFLTISTLPIWLYPVKFISHFYYAMDTISNLYWRQILYIGMHFYDYSFFFQKHWTILIYSSSELVSSLLKFVSSFKCRSFDALVVTI